MSATSNRRPPAAAVYTDSIWALWRSGTVNGIQMEMLVYIRRRQLALAQDSRQSAAPTSQAQPGPPAGVDELDLSALAANHGVMRAIFGPGWGDVVAIIETFTATPDDLLPHFITATEDRAAKAGRETLRYERIPKPHTAELFEALDRCLNAAALTIAHRLGAQPGKPLGLPYDEQEAANGLVVTVNDLDRRRFGLHDAVHDAVESAITSACCPRYTAAEHEALNGPWLAVTIPASAATAAEPTVGSPRRRAPGP